MNKFVTVLYWIWSCTWGSIMTIIGAIIALFLIISGHKPRVFRHNVYFRFGRGWGGVNFGAFFFLSEYQADSTLQHEAGHGLQNLILGPMMPFVVGIPSAFRCWLREYTYKGMKIAAAITLSVASALGVVLFILGLAHSLTAIWVIGLLIVLYAAILAIWMFKKEIPQYANNAYVDYDSIWFEGCATRWGEKCFSLE